MIETLIKCDKCGKPAKQYRFLIDRTIDASGNGYENQWKHFDYCFEHLIEFARDNKEYAILEN